MNKQDDKLSQDEIRDSVIEVLKTIYDPEIPVNIYDLGLIYDIAVNEMYDVTINMTLTAPGCPVAQSFPGHVEMQVVTVPYVNTVSVELVWDPPWTKDKMSEAAQLQLGMF